MNYKSILASIKDAVNSIENLSENKKAKALDLCYSIYNLYIYNGGDFNQYQSLSSTYFEKIIKTKSYVHEVRKALIENSILEVNNSYSVVKHISKGYRFNNEIINGNYSKYILNHSSSNIQSISLHRICYPILDSLNKLAFSPDVYQYVSHYTIDPKQVLVNDNIKESNVDITHDKLSYRYTTEKALQVSKSLNIDLISYKDKYYMESLDTFIPRKTNDAKLIYLKMIADIENKDFYASRNDTNNRLDYNLTNMKSELINYLQIGNQPLVELDIANAQFAILNYIFDDVDNAFTQNVIAGSLYSTVEKDKMFRVAFDRVKKDQDDVRLIYPKTMDVIDSYKRTNGYKSLSILLQNKEAEIMIDGVYTILNDSGFTVFPKHDAILVKKSDAGIVKKIVEDYFVSIGFKCLLRIKGGQKLN